MSRVESIAKIKTYPGDDRDPQCEIRLRSHWNYDDRLHLIISDKEVIVLADDLREAIRRVTR